MQAGEMKRQVMAPESTSAGRAGAPVFVNTQVHNIHSPNTNNSRLRLAAKVGDIVHTKQGVFQNQPCAECKAHHKVSLSLKAQPPCAKTAAGVDYLARHKGEEIDIQTSTLERLLLKDKKNSQKKMMDSASSKSLPPKLCKALSSPSNKSLTMQNTPIRMAVSDRSVPRLEISSPRDKPLPPISPERPNSAQGRLGSIPREIKEMTPVPPKTLDKTLGIRRRMVAAQRQRSASLERDLSNKTIAEKAKMQGGKLGWKDIFSDSQLSSDSSDLEGSERSMGAMGRSLMREMFAQEEEALRLRLVKDKQTHQQNLRKLKSLELERTAVDLKANNTLGELRKQLRELMEQEMILSITKNTLDDYYLKMRARKLSSSKHLGLKPRPRTSPGAGPDAGAIAKEATSRRRQQAWMSKIYKWSTSVPHDNDDAGKAPSSVATPTTLRGSSSSSSGSGEMSTSSSSEGRHRLRNIRERPGPTAVTPRPTSAHPMRRPDLYPPSVRRKGREVPRGSAGRRRRPLRRGRGRGRVVEEEESGTLDIIGEEEVEEEEEGEVEGEEEREVSFVVSLPCRDSTPSQPPRRLGNAGEEEYDDDPDEVASSVISYKVSAGSQTPAHDVIAKTRRASSIIKHTDSLDLIEQQHGGGMGTPSAMSLLAEEESLARIRKTRRESSIVGHVDSLILLEEHPSRSELAREEEEEDEEEEDDEDEEERLKVGMAEIRREVKELEHEIAHYTEAQEAASYPLVQHQYFKLKREELNSRDSNAIPTIFVSPCNSQNEMAVEEMQTILLRCQDIANEIIGKAIDVTSVVASGEGGGVELEELLTATTSSASSVSRISVQTKEMVHSIIEHALALSLDPNLSDPDYVSSLPDAWGDAFGHTPEEAAGNLSPVQSDILNRAKCMIYNTISRAIQSNMYRRRSIEAVIDVDRRLSPVQSDLVLYKARAVVHKVVKRAIELNMGRIKALYSEVAMKAMRNEGLKLSPVYSHDDSKGPTATPTRAAEDDRDWEEQKSAAEFLARFKRKRKSRDSKGSVEDLERRSRKRRKRSSSKHSSYETEQGKRSSVVKSAPFRSSILRSRKTSGKRTSKSASFADGAETRERGTGKPKKGGGAHWGAREGEVSDGGTLPQRSSEQVIIQIETASISEQDMDWEMESSVSTTHTATRMVNGGYSSQPVSDSHDTFSSDAERLGGVPNRTSIPSKLEYATRWAETAGGGGGGGGDGGRMVVEGESLKLKGPSRRYAASEPRDMGSRVKGRKQSRELKGIMKKSPPPPRPSLPPRMHRASSEPKKGVYQVQHEDKVLKSALRSPSGRRQKHARPSMPAVKVFSEPALPRSILKQSSMLEVGRSGVGRMPGRQLSISFETKLSLTKPSRFLHRHLSMPEVGGVSFGRMTKELQRHQPKWFAEVSQNAVPKKLRDLWESEARDQDLQHEMATSQEGRRRDSPHVSVSEPRRSILKESAALKGKSTLEMQARVFETPMTDKERKQSLLKEQRGLELRPILKHTKLEAGEEEREEPVSGEEGREGEALEHAKADAASRERTADVEGEQSPVEAVPPTGTRGSSDDDQHLQAQVPQVSDDGETVAQETADEKAKKVETETQKEQPTSPARARLSAVMAEKDPDRFSPYRLGSADIHALEEMQERLRKRRKSHDSRKSSMSSQGSLGIFDQRRRTTTLSSIIALDTETNNMGNGSIDHPKKRSSTSVINKGTNEPKITTTVSLPILDSQKTRKRERRRRRRKVAHSINSRHTNSTNVSKLFSTITQAASQPRRVFRRVLVKKASSRASRGIQTGLKPRSQSSKERGLSRDSFFWRKFSLDSNKRSRVSRHSKGNSRKRHSRRHSVQLPLEPVKKRKPRRKHSADDLNSSLMRNRRLTGARGLLSPSPDHGEEEERRRGRRRSSNRRSIGHKRKSSNSLVGKISLIERVEADKMVSSTGKGSSDADQHLQAEQQDSEPKSSSRSDVEEAEQQDFEPKSSSRSDVEEATVTEGEQQVPQVSDDGETVVAGVELSTTQTEANDSHKQIEVSSPQHVESKSLTEDSTQETVDDKAILDEKKVEAETQLTSSAHAKLSTVMAQRDSPYRLTSASIRALEEIQERLRKRKRKSRDSRMSSVSTQGSDQRRLTELSSIFVHDTETNMRKRLSSFGSVDHAKRRRGRRSNRYSSTSTFNRGASEHWIRSSMSLPIFDRPILVRRRRRRVARSVNSRGTNSTDMSKLHMKLSTIMHLVEPKRVCRRVLVRRTTSRTSRGIQTGLKPTRSRSKGLSRESFFSSRKSSVDSKRRSWSRRSKRNSRKRLSQRRSVQLPLKPKKRKPQRKHSADDVNPSMMRKQRSTSTRRLHSPSPEHGGDGEGKKKKKRSSSRLTIGQERKSSSSLPGKLSLTERVSDRKIRSPSSGSLHPYLHKKLRTSSSSSVQRSKVGELTNSKLEVLRSANSPHTVTRQRNNSPPAQDPAQRPPSPGKDEEDGKGRNKEGVEEMSLLGVSPSSVKSKRSQVSKVSKATTNNKMTINCCQQGTESASSEEEEVSYVSSEELAGCFGIRKKTA